ncbi:TPA: GNAT family N-acetyltransferase, partial [Enterobacter roggenkampii]
MTITSSPRLILRSFKESDALALLDYLSSPRTPCFQDEMLNSVEDAVEEV